jgi:LmbE family N-acetylglucosaminyl deacetylase
MSAAVTDLSPFAGDILVCAPHMDDDALGCGMLIALHARRGRVHVLFASDGALSPEPPRDRPGAARELPAVRAAEALAGLAVLGVPRLQVSFLNFPDGSLARHQGELSALVSERAQAIHATAVLVPFRYDRHPDHLALNRAVTSARLAGRIAADLVEYFVYAKWRLLRTGDVRDYAEPGDIVRIRSAEAARLKRTALACHRTQTTMYFPGQRRPILTGALLDQTCEEPESFLFHRAGRDGRRGLARGRYWVPLACALEPGLKRLKDRLTGERVQ